MNDQNETVSQTSDTGADTGKLDQGSEDKADSKKKTRKRTGCFTCRRRKVTDRLPLSPFSNR